MIALLLLCLAALVTADSPATITTNNHANDAGISVQTGYEGYLVPSDHESSTGLGGISSLALSFLTGGDPLASIASLFADLVTSEEGNGGVTSIESGNKNQLNGAHIKPIAIPLPLKRKLSKLKSLGPKKFALAKIVSKLIVTVVIVAIIFLLTGGVAASVCAFTPLCSISFVNDNVQHVRSLVPSNSFNQISSFVLDAIEKYQQYQNN